MYKDNPFKGSINATYITSPVLIIEALDDEHRPLHVVDLEVTLPFKVPASTPTLTEPAYNASISYHMFNLTLSHSLILFRLDPHNDTITYEVFISPGSFPTVELYNTTVTMSAEIGDYQAAIPVTNTGDPYYIGIKQCE